MKLAILHMRGRSGPRVIQALTERGLPVELVSDTGGRAGDRRMSALAGIGDGYVQLLYDVIDSFGGSVVSVANPFVPFVDPGEYHVHSPVPSHEGGVTVYLLRLRRYERVQ